MTVFRLKNCTEEILLDRDKISNLCIKGGIVFVDTIGGQLYDMLPDDEGVDFLLWWFREEARLSYEKQKENYENSKGGK